MSGADFARLILAALLGGLLGGGAILKLLFRAQRDALMESLEKRFSTRDELNGFGSRVKRVEEETHAAIEMARTTHGGLSRLEGTVNDRLLLTLDEIRSAQQRHTADGDEVREHLLLHAQALRQALKRLGADDSELPPLPTRKRG